MKKKLDLSTMLSMVHLTFVLSIACFSTMYLTVGILALPALTSAFRTGREVIYRQYDVYDSVIKNFFRNMKAEMRMMKYFPVQLLITLQAVGMYAVSKIDMSMLMIPMLAGTAFLITLIVYTCAYHVFYEEMPKILDAVIAMFYRVQYIMIIWVLMLLAVMFFGAKMMIFLFFAGALVLFAVEAVAFLDIIAFKKFRNALTDEDKERIGEDIIKKL